jgi:hypothetical protein
MFLGMGRVSIKFYHLIQAVSSYREDLNPVQ